MQKNILSINNDLLNRDIKKLLNIIIEKIELIYLQTLIPVLRKHIHEIFVASQHLLSITNALEKSSQEQTNPLIQSNVSKVTEKMTSEEPIKPCCVLLVEDQVIVQKVLGKFLERLGCQVELAIDGKEVLTKDHCKYQLIFMDLGLPDIDGYEVMAEIRRREQGIKPVPIIVLTAYILSEVTEKCLAVGADAVFNKPIYLETLKMILETYLSK